ncbi:DUF4886 domain-containing protein [Planctomyces sp. SH-PL62]|uniref:DUF4886 domain-containing protein n=1 Tax=Planctomyces sp. SH-PL62 TaxID=1636152 RepID=UPI00078D7758|nr:DUF4886 domain-containing protein [Planctomyces sp. SH-PL62]AMV40319.1 hypothetical protein VT85_23005 [Planctomyces sp. SH-PL62]
MNHRVEAGVRGPGPSWRGRSAVALMLGVWIASAAATAPPAWGQAVPDREAATVRLLTVGNSFSRDATRFLGDVVAAQGDALVHHSAAIPGGTLAQHCEKQAIHAENPEDPRGLYDRTGRSLAQELRDGPWDFITVQQASIRSHDVSTYRPFAERLVGILRRGAPGARVVVHETWAYRIDDPRFDPAVQSAPGQPTDQEAMYGGLAGAYRTIARELEAPLIPVGDAFHLADADPAWGYKPDPAFDLAGAAYPVLPNQKHSLHVGRKWSKDEDGTYRMVMDGHHANVAGQYLGALVFYESLYGRSAVGCRFRPNGINAEYARFLQETAHKAVEALKGTEFEVKSKIAAPASASR